MARSARGGMARWLGEVKVSTGWTRGQVDLCTAGPANRNDRFASCDNYLLRDHKELFARFCLRYYFRAQRLSSFVGEHVPERIGAFALRDGPFSFESPTVDFGR